MLSDQARFGGSSSLLLYGEAVKVSHNFIIGPCSNCGVKQWKKLTGSLAYWCLFASLGGGGN